MPKTLLVFLTDPLAVFQTKGEIRTRYYNPAGLFDEVHFISPAAREVDPRTVQALVGNARLVLHPLGASYYATAWAQGGRLARLLKTIAPQVVRAYDPGVRGTLAAHWGARLGVPSVISLHADLDEQRAHERRPLHAVRRPFERYALTHATAVMCVSHHVADYARRHGAVDPVVVYNRVYADEFGGVRPAASSGPARILCVGRLVPQKYQECLIRAMQGLDARLLIIGDGELRDPLQQLARDLGVAAHVTFRPSVPHREIPAYYRDADIFAIATHYEGFCIPVLEAMASGLPVVASRVGPIPEIVGDTGVLVDNAPGAFHEALAALIADAPRRASLGARAAERARTMDGRVMEEREAALYRAVCG